MIRGLVGAVVVLFHPDIPQLRQLYENLQPQVDLLWFVDNTPGASGDESHASPGKLEWKVIYRGLGENRGIAAAQNIGIKEAIGSGCTHVLLLDQDSFLPVDTVKKLLEAEQHLLDQHIKVAAVGALFIDQKTGLPGKSHRHRWFRLQKPLIAMDAQHPVGTDWLIASGSLVRSSVFREIGLMREELFIDAVDMEWGMRALSRGFKSFVLPTAQIAHSVGDSFAKLMGIRIMLHDSVRHYYIVRNWIYLLRLPTMGARWRSGALLHVTKFVMVHAWLDRRRGTRLKLLASGLLDGARGSMGPYRG